MRFIVHFILFPVLVLGLCCTANNEQEETKIRIVNQSQFKITDLSLFSINFDELNPKETSEFKVLNFNELEDTPMIYGTVNGIRLSRYLELVSLKQNYTYIIDSIQPDNRVIFVTLLKDE